MVQEFVQIAAAYGCVLYNFTFFLKMESGCGIIFLYELVLAHVAMPYSVCT